MYAGFEADCCPAARQLIEQFGGPIVWTFGMMIYGYPITWHIDEMDSIKLSNYLKRNFGALSKWLEL